MIPVIQTRCRVAADNREMLELETGETLPLPSTGFAQRPGEAVTLGIRPNHLSVIEGGSVHMEVKSVEQLGGEAYVYGTLKNGQSLTLHLPGQIGAGIGEVLTLAPDGQEVHLFDTDTGLTLRMD